MGNRLLWLTPIINLSHDRFWSNILPERSNIPSYKNSHPTFSLTKPIHRHHVDLEWGLLGVVCIFSQFDVTCFFRYDFCTVHARGGKYTDMPYLLMPSVLAAMSRGTGLPSPSLSMECVSKWPFGQEGRAVPCLNHWWCLFAWLSPDL